jgi:hypothetical protein
MTKYVRKPPQVNKNVRKPPQVNEYVRKPPQIIKPPQVNKLVINLESRFITDILPSDAARPRGQYISYKPPSRFITLTYLLTFNLLDQLGYFLVQ